MLGGDVQERPRSKARRAAEGRSVSLTSSLAQKCAAHRPLFDPGGYVEIP